MSLGSDLLSACLFRDVSLWGGGFLCLMNSGFGCGLFGNLGFFGNMLGRGFGCVLMDFRLGFNLLGGGDLVGDVGFDSLFCDLLVSGFREKES